MSWQPGRKSKDLNRTKCGQAAVNESQPLQPQHPLFLFTNSRLAGTRRTSSRMPPRIRLRMGNSKRKRYVVASDQFRRGFHDLLQVYCICRTPYDETKFYVGCDLCNNWFHGECVDITEESSKSLTEFVCEECKQARETQKLYCLCQQPYDDSQ